MLFTAIGCRGELQAQRADRATALRSLIEAERSFARAARDSGTQAAFLANIAANGILFRPAPVAGAAWLRENPPPPGDSSLLGWDPRWADVSAAGDLGFTTGPFELRLRGAADTVAARGHYVTVWRRQADGGWRFALDIGVSGPPSPQMGDSVRTASAPVATPRARAPDDLLTLDRRLGATTSDQASLLSPYLVAESWIFRRRRPPAMGPEAIARVLADTPGTLASRPIASDVAASGDLGYTYGSYELASSDRGRRLDEAGHYLRIWRRDGAGEWRLALDILNPTPPRAPSPE